MFNKEETHSIIQNQCRPFGLLLPPIRLDFQHLEKFKTTREYKVLSIDKSLPMIRVVSFPPPMLLQDFAKELQQQHRNAYPQQGFVTKGRKTFFKIIAHGNASQANVAEKQTMTPDSSPRPRTSGCIVLLPPPQCVPGMKHTEYLVPITSGLLPADQLDMAIEGGCSDARVFACLFVV